MINKEADFMDMIKTPIEGGLKTVGMLGEGSKVLVPLALTTLLGGPLLAGYALGKVRKRLKDAGTPTPEELERELLKNKYDETIANIADKRKLLSGVKLEE